MGAGVLALPYELEVVAVLGDRERGRQPESRIAGKPRCGMGIVQVAEIYDVVEVSHGTPGTRVVFPHVGTAC
jgi:hypothetical protein